MPSSCLSVSRLKSSEAAGPLRERPAPDIARVPAQQRLARVTGGLDAPGQQVNDGSQHRAVIVSVRPVGGAQPVDQARPGSGRRERRAGRQDTRPALRQVRERAGMGPQQRVQPAHPCLGEAAEQDVRERRRRLPLPAGRHLDAVHEMQVEIGVGAEGEQVVVVLGGRGRSDGDVGGLRPAGHEQLARPAHGLDRLVVGRGGAPGGDVR